jgi:hypothetical protein
MDMRDSAVFKKKKTGPLPGNRSGNSGKWWSLRSSAFHPIQQQARLESYETKLKEKITDPAMSRIFVYR